MTLSLDIVKQACVAKEAVGATPSGVTREEVWREVVERLRGAHGEKAKFPSQKTVGRWLDRWVEDGMLVKGRRTGVQAGSVPWAYKTPSTPTRARALPLNGVSFVRIEPNPLQEQGSDSDMEMACPNQTDPPEDGVDRGEASAENPAASGQSDSDIAKPCPNQELVPDCDLGSFGQKTPEISLRACAREAEDPGEVLPLSEAPECDVSEDEWDAACGEEDFLHRDRNGHPPISASAAASSVSLTSM